MRFVKWNNNPQLIFPLNINLVLAVPISRLTVSKVVAYFRNTHKLVLLLWFETSSYNYQLKSVWNTCNLIRLDSAISFALSFLSTKPIFLLLLLVCYPQEVIFLIVGISGQLICNHRYKRLDTIENSRTCQAVCFPP